MIGIESPDYEFFVEYVYGAKNFPQYKVRRESLTQAQLLECTDYSVRNEEREVQNNLMCYKKNRHDFSILLINDLIKMTKDGVGIEKKVGEYGGVKPALKEFLVTPQVPKNPIE